MRVVDVETSKRERVKERTFAGKGGDSEVVTRKALSFCARRVGLFPLFSATPLCEESFLSASASFPQRAIHG